MTRMIALGLLVLGVGQTSCEKVVNVEPDPIVEQTAPPRLPINRLLTDKQGRSIDAKITERGPNFIKLIRKSDGKAYEFPTNRLSEKDLLFVQDLPLTITKPLKKPTPPYVANRLKELEELKLQLQVVKNDLRRTLSEIKERGLKDEKSRLENRIRRLEDQISTYKRQNPEK